MKRSSLHRVCSVCQNWMCYEYFQLTFCGRVSLHTSQFFFFIGWFQRVAKVWKCNENNLLKCIGISIKYEYCISNTNDVLYCLFEHIQIFKFKYNYIWLTHMLGMVKKKKWSSVWGPNDPVHLKRSRHPITKSHSRHSRAQCWSQKHKAGSCCGYSGHFVVTCLLQRRSRWGKKKKNPLTFCCMFITDPSGLILLTRLFEFPSFMDGPVWPHVWFVKVKNASLTSQEVISLYCCPFIFLHIEVRRLSLKESFNSWILITKRLNVHCFSVGCALFHLIWGGKA